MSKETCIIIQTAESEIKNKIKNYSTFRQAIAILIFTLKFGKHLIKCNRCRA